MKRKKKRGKRPKLDQGRETAKRKDAKPTMKGRSVGRNVVMQENQRGTPKANGGKPLLRKGGPSSYGAACWSKERRGEGAPKWGTFFRGGFIKEKTRPTGDVVTRKEPEGQMTTGPGRSCPGEDRQRNPKKSRSLSSPWW